MGSFRSALRAHAARYFLADSHIWGKCGPGEVEFKVRFFDELHIWGSDGPGGMILAQYAS